MAGSLKGEIVRSVLGPFFEEVGRAAGKKLSNKLFGKEKKAPKKSSSAKKKSREAKKSGENAPAK